MKCHETYIDLLVVHMLHEWMDVSLALNSPLSHFIIFATL